MAAKFVPKKGSTGKFAAYESQASAIKGIESVKRNAPNAEIDDRTEHVVEPAAELRVPIADEEAHPASSFPERK